MHTPVKEELTFSHHIQKWDPSLECYVSLASQTVRESVAYLHTEVSATSRRNNLSLPDVQDLINI